MTNETMEIVQTVANATAQVVDQVVPPQYVGIAEQFVTIAGAVVIVASLITAGTKTPDPNTKWGKAYKVIEVLALVFGKAKK